VPAAGIVLELGRSFFVGLIISENASRWRATSRALLRLQHFGGRYEAHFDLSVAPLCSVGSLRSKALALND
jgi:hypothetical protein